MPHTIGKLFETILLTTILCEVGVGYSAMSSLGSDPKTALHYSSPAY